MEDNDLAKSSGVEESERMLPSKKSEGRGCRDAEAICGFPHGRRVKSSWERTGTLLLALMLSSLPASALTVTTTADEFDVPAGAEVSLREAIRDTVSGGTVDFELSLNGKTIELTMGEISISSTTLIIDASGLSLGLTISGQGNSRVLSAVGSTLDLVGLTLTGGSAAFNGGALDISVSSTVTMTGCRFFSNEATIGGGAISCAFSDLILNDCWLGYNEAGGHGGAIVLSGSSSDLTLIDSTLAHNTAQSGGGGLRADTINSITVQGSTLSHNETAGPGGGIYLVATPIIVENSTLVGNSSVAAGGGLYSNHDVDLFSCTITGNSSELSGGGLFMIGLTNREFHNTIVAGNSSVDAADFDFAGFFITISGVNFIGTNDGCDTDFPAGSPNGNGDIVGTDAAPLDPLLGPLAIYGGGTETCHPLANSPVIDAGGVTTLTTDQRGFGRPVGAAADIGAVETGPPLVVTTSLDEDDGSLGAGVGDSLRECLDVAAGTGDHVTFAAGLDGLTIALGGTQMGLNSKSVFVDASSLSSGITVNATALSRMFNLTNQSALALHSVNLADGFVTGAANPTGGAIRALNSSVTVIGALISGCAVTGTSTSRGGAIGLTGVTAPGTAILIDCTFSMNAAHSAPGANHGGAVDLDPGSARLERCAFIHNLALGGAAASNSAGALSASGGVLLAEDCTFDSNTVSAASAARAGALSTRSVTLLDRCTFKGNTLTVTAPTGAASGGAVELSSGAPLFVRNATFTGNTAVDDGGAIAVLGNLVLEHCTISGNTATNGEGGGIRLGTGNASFENSIIAANSAGASAADVIKAGGFGFLIDDGGNLIGDNESIAAEFPVGPLVGDSVNPLDPDLGVIDDWGGSTETIPLRATSLAIDAAAGGPGTIPTDQRGYARSIGTGPDIGAYEAGNRVGYAVWAAEEIPAALDATFDGNSEGDANQNGIEYACGLNPRVADGGSVLNFVLIPPGGGGPEVHLSFPYEPDAPDLQYFIRRSGDLTPPFAGRYRYNSADGDELFHPSGNVTSVVDPGGKTITVIDAGIGLGPLFWRLEVSEIP